MCLNINVIFSCIRRYKDQRTSADFVWRYRYVFGVYFERISFASCSGNKELRERLASKSLEELTDILSRYKKLHNSTDVDTVKRAIRAIEIEEYYLTQDVNARSFPEIHSLIVGVDIDRDLRRQKITNRLKKRLQEGMVDEVKALLKEGISPDDLIYYGLEYKYLTLYAVGKLSYDEMFSQLEIAIHQFAKRQMTWFRGMERRGFQIHWIDAEAPLNENVERIIDLIK